MLKTEFAEWIRQTLFPVQAFEAAGGSVFHKRERSNASLHLGSIVAGAARRVWTEAVRWHQARRTVAELTACSDRTLQDIGIDRSEITSIAYFGGKERRRRQVNFD